MNAWTNSWIYTVRNRRMALRYAVFDLCDNTTCLVHLTLVHLILMAFWFLLLIKCKHDAMENRTCKEWPKQNSSFFHICSAFTHHYCAMTLYGIVGYSIKIKNSSWFWEQFFWPHKIRIQPQKFASTVLKFRSTYFFKCLVWHDFGSVLRIKPHYQQFIIITIALCKRPPRHPFWFGQLMDHGPAKSVPSIRGLLFKLIFCLHSIFRHYSYLQSASSTWSFIRNTLTLNTAVADVDLKPVFCVHSDIICSLHKWLSRFDFEMFSLFHKLKKSQ